MISASFAAVPFYSWFCRATGFGGTTQVSQAAPAKAFDRKVMVRFDSNLAPGLPWSFEPEQNQIEVRVGEVTTVNYKVINRAARTITAQAAYNVAPLTAGAYFAKINCFCFTEQTLKAGESREMAVVFYVDPAIVNDREQDGLNTITLSYTFYRQRQPVAQAGEKRLNEL